MLLTGTGNDGHTGLFEMRGTIAVTFAQDEAPCAMFGMPRKARTGRKHLVSGLAPSRTCKWLKRLLTSIA